MFGVWSTYSCCAKIIAQFNSSTLPFSCKGKGEYQKLAKSQTKSQFTKTSSMCSIAVLRCYNKWSLGRNKNSSLYNNKTFWLQPRRWTTMDDPWLWGTKIIVPFFFVFYQKVISMSQVKVPPEWLTGTIAVMTRK